MQMKGGNNVNFSMSKKDYDKLVKENSPGSKVVRNCIFAFLFGGTFCVIGQFINMFFKYLNYSTPQAATLTSVTMIFIGALLTALNVYDNLAKYGGAGTLVPITGFANSVVASAMEFKSEGYVLGLGANMFKVAGPVIVFGTVTSFIYGVIYYILTMLGWIA